MLFALIVFMGKYRKGQKELHHLCGSRAKACDRGQEENSGTV